MAALAGLHLRKTSNAGPGVPCVASYWVRFLCQSDSILTSLTSERPWGVLSRPR